MSEEKFYRGDIFTTVKADQTEGSHCVIISNDEINEKNACVMVVYLNGDLDRMKDTDVIINAKGQKVAECNRIYTLHKSRLCEFIRSCTDAEMGEIDLVLAESLNIHGYTGPDLVDPEDEKEVEDLKEQVENLKAINRELAEKYKYDDPEKDELKMRCKESMAHAEEMEKRAIEAEKKAEILSADLSKAETKVDVYKDLYDETLDKLLGGKA